MNAALLSSKKMDWCTPQGFFDALNEEFGFVLDAAATDKTAKCSKYFTPETDGLSQSWDFGGAVFCNPPYGREIGKWVQKAFEEARGGTPLFYLFRRERTPVIFTNTFTGKRKYASFAVAFASRTKTGTPPIQRPSRRWLLSITEGAGRIERRTGNALLAGARSENNAYLQAVAMRALRVGRNRSGLPKLSVEEKRVDALRRWLASAGHSQKH